MVSPICYFLSFFQKKNNSCASLEDPTNISLTPPSSTTPDNIVMDLALPTTADKAVKVILPFLYLFGMFSTYIL